MSNHNTQDCDPRRRMIRRTAAALLFVTLVAIFASASPAPASADFRLCNNTGSRVGRRRRLQGQRRLDHRRLVEHRFAQLRNLAARLARRKVLLHICALTMIAAGNGRGKPSCARGTRNSRCAARKIASRAVSTRPGFFEVDTGEQQSWTVQLTEAA